METEKIWTTEGETSRNTSENDLLQVDSAAVDAVKIKQQMATDTILIVVFTVILLMLLHGYDNHFLTGSLAEKQSWKTRDQIQKKGAM